MILYTPRRSPHRSQTHPCSIAEKLALALLEGGHAFGPVTAVAHQVTMGNSRFDFVVTHADGSTTVVECKNVPIGVWRAVVYAIEIGLSLCLLSFLLIEMGHLITNSKRINCFDARTSPFLLTADYCDGTKKERAAIMAAPGAPSDPYGKLALFPEVRR